MLCDPVANRGMLFAKGSMPSFMLFFAVANSNYKASTLSSYVPAVSNNSAGGEPLSGLINALESFDVYGQLEYSSSRDSIHLQCAYL